MHATAFSSYSCFQQKIIAQSRYFIYTRFDNKQDSLPISNRKPSVSLVFFTCDSESSGTHHLFSTEDHRLVRHFNFTRISETSRTHALFPTENHQSARYFSHEFRNQAGLTSYLTENDCSVRYFFHTRFGTPSRTHNLFPIENRRSVTSSIHTHNSKICKTHNLFSTETNHSVR